MANISQAQKRELQRSLDQITDLCSGGEHPDNAIIKVAKQNNLSEDMLPILARSYNIGATALQWKSKNQNEKIASFPIADIDRINAILYPKAVKAASKKGVSIIDHTFEKSASSLNVDWFHREYDYNALPMVKSAAVYREEDKKAVVALDDAIIEKAMKLEQDASMQKVAAEDIFNQSIAELADEISYGVGLSNFKKTAKSLYGDVGVKLANYVAERFPTLKANNSLEKQASALSKNDSLLKTAEKALKNLSEYVAAELNYEKVLKKCASALKPIKERRENECFGPEIDRILMTPAEVKEATWKQARVDLLPSLKEYVQRTEGPAWDLASSSEREALKAMRDRSPLRNQKVKSLLLDLMSSDPYLRQQDPDVIVAAFNDLYEANPTDALKRIWLKTHLPQYIASENMDASLLGNIIEAGRSGAKEERERTRSIMDAVMNNISLRQQINAEEREEEKHQMAKEEHGMAKEQHKETFRANKAREKATEQSAKETARANRAKEKYMQDANAESVRAHKATESAQALRDTETQRANRETERLSRDKNNIDRDNYNLSKTKEDRERIDNLVRAVENMRGPRAYGTGRSASRAWQEDKNTWVGNNSARYGGVTHPFAYIRANVPGTHPIWSANISSRSNPLLLQRLMDEYHI